MPNEVSTTVSLIDWLARATVGTLAFAIIVGGYFELWYYGKTVKKRNADYEAYIAKLEKSEGEWKAMALDLLRTNRKLVKVEEERG